MNQIVIRLGNNEVLKTTKTLTFVAAAANANPAANADSQPRVVQ